MSVSKYERIAEALRGRILAGQYPVGGRLPTRKEMGGEFGASGITIQRAFEELLRDGFVVSRGCAGTFVAERPPHTSRFGIIFPSPRPRDPSTPASRWSTFYAEMINAATEIEQQEGVHFSFYYGFYQSTGSADYPRLAADVEAGRLAGLVIIQATIGLAGAPVLSHPHCPPIVMTGESLVPGATAVNFDYGVFIDAALDHFAAAGRRRVAAIALWGGGSDAVHWDHLRTACERRGLENRPHWNQIVGPERFEAANHVVQLLMHGDERPDALLIADDHLVEHATAGLAACGVRGANDLDVVAWSNLPYTPTAHVPVRFIGPDMREFVHTCIDLLRRKKAGEDCPKELLLPFRAALHQGGNVERPR